MKMMIIMMIVMFVVCLPLLCVAGGPGGPGGPGCPMPGGPLLPGIPRSPGNPANNIKSTYDLIMTCIKFDNNDRTKITTGRLKTLKLKRESCKQQLLQIVSYKSICMSLMIIPLYIYTQTLSHTTRQWASSFHYCTARQSPGGKNSNCRHMLQERTVQWAS